MTSQAARLETIKYLSPDELRSLFGAIDSKRDRALFLFAYRHGLRAAEVPLLRVADLDLKRLRVRIHRVKGSLGGEHPMQPDEVKALKAYLKERDHPSPYLFLSRRGEPLSVRTLDWLMKRYGERAGLPPEKRHFHTLKHSIATHLLSHRAELRFVQDWLGHANIQNTVVYTALVAELRDESARAVFLKMPRF